MLEDLIKNYLSQAKNIPLEKFEEPDLQVVALDLDSLDLVEMLFEVEDRCGFQLADPMRYPTMTFKAMVADIEAQVRQYNNGQMPTLNFETNT